MRRFLLCRRLTTPVVAAMVLMLPLSAYSFFYFSNIAYTTSVPVLLRGEDPATLGRGHTANWSDFSFIYVNFGMKVAMVNASGYTPNETLWFQNDYSKNGRHVFYCESALNVFLSGRGSTLRAQSCDYAIWVLGLDQTPDVRGDNSAYCIQRAAFRL